MEAITMEYAILIYREESRDNEFDWPQIETDYEVYFKQAAEAGILQQGTRLGSSAATTAVKVRDGDRLRRSMRPRISDLERKRRSVPRQLQRRRNKLC